MTTQVDVNSKKSLKAMLLVTMRHYQLTSEPGVSSLTDHVTSEDDKTGNHEKIQLSLVLPVYNEAQSIEHTINELYHEISTKTGAEIIVREGGSTDGTKEVLLKMSESLPLKPILRERKGGYMKDVKDGLRNTNTRHVFFIDSDGQYAASDFWKLYDKIDDFDMIVGRKVRRADPIHRIILSKVFHKTIGVVFKLPLHDPDCGYRIINRNVLEEVLEEVKFLEYSFWSEFTIRAFKKGFRIVEIPIQHRKRLSGGTKLYTPDRILTIMLLQFIGLLRLWKELRKQQRLTPS